MINKFKKINNVFSYSFFDWDTINPNKGNNPNDPIDIFKKNNIIFAENGNGKTNLINIIKVLNGENSINLEKHWDYPGEDQNIILEIDNELSFDSRNWSDIYGALKERFIIFDKYYIEKFVHSVGIEQPNTAARKQDRGKNILYLGKFTEYNQEINKINNLKVKISERNNRFWSEEKEKINRKLPEWLTLTEIDNDESEIKKIDITTLSNKLNTVQKQRKELEKYHNALKKQSEIEELNKLDEIKTTFDLNIEEFDENGERSTYKIDSIKLFNFNVSSGIKETLLKINNKESFIKTGLKLIDSATENCPFCEQKIKNGDFIQIIKDYQSIFDHTFLHEEEKVKKSLERYKSILFNLREFQPAPSNTIFLQKAQEFINIETSIPICFLNEDEKRLIEKEIQLVIDKENNILNQVSGSSIEEIKAIVDKANSMKRDYNNALKEINKKIDTIKLNSKEGKLNEVKINIEYEIRKLEKEIFYIENKDGLLRYFEAKIQNQTNEKVINNLESIYQKLKEKIIEKFNDFAREYFDLIKNYIKAISPSMDIFDILGEGTYSRTGREPAQCGFEIQYNNKDCTSNLSEGEKQVIALSFFFAQLKKETDKSKIIILDDPITSFDAGKRKSTAEVIRSETHDFEQLFIFTCDPLFREYCLKEFQPGRNFYYIFNTRRSSAIHYVPKNKETIYESFEEDFKDIDNIIGSDENIVINGQKLRFCLETRIKEDYFGYSEDNLANMIQRVTGNGKQKFENLIDNKEKIINLYSYCNTGGLAHYPRDGATSWNELKGKIQEYLDLNL